MTSIPTPVSTVQTWNPPAVSSFNSASTTMHSLPRSQYHSQSQSQSYKKTSHPPSNTVSSSLSSEEKSRRLLEMMQDANTHDAAATTRFIQAKQADKLESQEYLSRKLNVSVDGETSSGVITAKFLDDMNKQIYLQGNDRLEDVLNKRKHYRMKGNADEHQYI